jgi:hypothetical protein
MPSVNTYQVYISGTLGAPIFGGDIDPLTHQITPAIGSSVIVINLSNLLDSFGGSPVSFDLAAPITFVTPASQPGFVAWTLLSPVQILVTDMNSNNQSVQFTLNTSAGSLFTANRVSLGGVDPTIVNTYVPPPMMSYQPAAASQRQVA